MSKEIIIDGIHTGYHINTHGVVFSKKDKPMSMYLINSGYLCVKLKCKPWFKSRAFLVHRLVASTFIGEIPEGYVVDHIDENKLNNELSNLQIIPFISNVRKAMENNNFPQGEKHYLAKYTEAQVRKACRLLQTGEYSYDEIEKLTGIDRLRLAHIRCGSKWRHISKDYTFPPTPRSKDKRSKKKWKFND